MFRDIVEKTNDDFWKKADAIAGYSTYIDLIKDIIGKKEIISIAGHQITKESYSVYSPAFDVTPNELISGIITEAGLYKQPYNFLDV